MRGNGQDAPLLTGTLDVGNSSATVAETSQSLSLLLSTPLILLMVDAFAGPKKEGSASTEAAATAAWTKYQCTLSSCHFPDTTVEIEYKHIPKSCHLTGNKDSDGNALNTGISVWFGADNLIDTIATVLDSCVPLHRGRVLELGAGIGKTGLFVLEYFLARGRATHTTAQVDLTDGIEETLVLLNTNVDRWRTQHAQQDDNAIEAASSEKSVDLVEATVSKNWWGQRRADGGFNGLATQYTSGEDRPGYHVVFGGDLIYERREDAKVRALALTVVWMLSGVERTIDFANAEPVETPADGYLSEKTFCPGEFLHHGVFVLAFTRRSYPLPALIEIFIQSGLAYEGTLEDSCYDLFGNCTDGLTEMWRDCIVVFTLEKHQ